MRTLSPRALNRAVLSRQLLLERSGLALPRALDRLGGIQAQYAPSMYVGLWSRLRGLERDMLTRALERRTVVQATLMRSTIHLVSAADFWPLAIATRAARRQLYLRTFGDVADARAMAAAARKLHGALRGGATLGRRDVEALLGKERARGVGLWVDLVRVPPSGTWDRRRADLYGLAADWIGPPPADLDVPAAIAHLVRRYLSGFGPASRADVIGFTGIAGRPLDPVLAHMPLRRFAAEDGTELLDLPRAALPDPQTPAPPRFLPTWDAVLLVHARRAGVLPEIYRPRVFTSRNPHSLATFLVDGAVAGSWRWQDGEIVLDPWERIDAAALRALREEAERLAAFHR